MPNDLSARTPDRLRASEHARDRFQFGLFELDAETLELRREGAIVHLQAQPAQVLLCLVRNADRILVREELHKAVWGDKTFVDFERGLNFCISQIRSALGDDPTRPTYIRTVARQGYQFIAPVRSIASTSGRTQKFSISAIVADKRLLMAGAAVLVLIALGLAVMYALHSRATKPVAIVAVVRFDNETGDPGLTRFSDDLTDNFVERLTSLSNGRYAVIGNAQILRGPRSERNLKAVAASLRADYVVLGQVQAYQGQTRILVHLIRMPEQTHVKVARMDRPLGNLLELEAEAAQKIALEFSQRLITLTNSTSSPAASP